MEAVPIAYTTPLTAVSNATLTAAQWNASVRDNLLTTAPALATASGQLWVSTAANAGAMRVPTGGTVAASETTVSTGYATLATVGPTFAVTTGTSAIISVGAGMAQSTVNGFASSSVAISGATTVAAGTDGVVNFRASTSNAQIQASLVYLKTGLAGGSNTFTQQYTAGGGGGTATFFGRFLVVFPL